MKTERYFIQSEHVRGEPRMYWIVDRLKDCESVADSMFSDKRKVNRLLSKLIRKSGGKETQGGHTDYVKLKPPV